MSYAMNEILQFVQENDVKFVRLAFCDIYGEQKNISIMPKELTRAFEQGISFDASAISGFMNIEKSDLFLYPDPSTMTILPWRPQTGRVVRFFCNIRYANGQPFEGDGRYILKTKIEKLQEMGIDCKIGTECEFYLFQMDDQAKPTKIPHDLAGYFDIAPKDKAENVRREICLTLEEMNIIPETSHHEQGPGQNEIVFKYSDILSAADNLITFKSVVKTIAQRNGLFASFMPKPLKDESGNGLHINLSIYKNGINLIDTQNELNSNEAGSFIAGILKHVCAMTAFLNPTTNSYERFGKFEAPKYVSWSHENRSQLIRIPSTTNHLSRMELRCADTACNPYLIFSLLVSAGIEGINEKQNLSEPTNVNLYMLPENELKDFQTLADNLKDAIEAARQSAFIKDALPEHMMVKYLDAKEAEWKEYCKAGDKDYFETLFYFYNL